MSATRVCILRAAGTNCDLETERAWEMAGARPERIHLRRLIERPSMLTDYAILTIPGGFSYGDDISAGRLFAAQLERHLVDHVREFVARGGLVLGICNGFQVLVKAGLLPDVNRGLPDVNGPAERRTCTVTYNEPRGFQDRWVTLEAGPHPCAFLEPGRRYEMPIAHGEGRVVFSSDHELRRVQARGLDVVKYVSSAGSQKAGGGSQEGTVGSQKPYNPNGSQGDIAGLCDETGRVLGLMPHPDRFVVGTQHPRWTALPPREFGDGLALFERAVSQVKLVSHTAKSRPVAVG